MRSRHASLLTAVAPALWGTTYIVTTELLPPGRPLLAAALRALPAGLAVIAITRTLPRGDWWWRAAVLGTCNFGIFFSLLFTAAYRLPGGVAATVGAVQPLLVMLLAAGLLRERATSTKVLAGLAGVVGVALLVLDGSAQLDPVGVAAALGGAASMATGSVLVQRWGRPTGALTFAGWQLTAGGVVLLPMALVVEGTPEALTATNLAGYGYLAVLGGALAYTLWFRGIERLGAGNVTFLALLSPLVATTVGVVAGERLSPTQALGAATVLGSVVTVQRAARRGLVPVTSVVGGGDRPPATLEDDEVRGAVVGDDLVADPAGVPLRVPPALVDRPRTSPRLDAPAPAAGS
ncbi:MAG TPA: EamA family transporter [Acidimicrobiales bacterium]|nr:EamA family transporter [Acidimicrobiales bacterium]